MERKKLESAKSRNLLAGQRKDHNFKDHFLSASLEHHLRPGSALTSGRIFSSNPDNTVSLCGTIFRVRCRPATCRPSLFVLPLLQQSLQRPALQITSSMSTATVVADPIAGPSARPPRGFRVLDVPPGQIRLPLTISNKCGQAFRWRSFDVWEPEERTYQVERANGFVKPEKTEFKVKQEEGGPELEEDAKDLVKQEYNSHETVSRWTRWTEWSLCLSDRVVLLRQDEERGKIYYRTLLAPPAKESTINGEGGDIDLIEAESGLWLRDYLNLDVPLEALYLEWTAKDPVFARFATRFSGVRMLRQDPWECLCAFICSSNNNIARIGQMVQSLCTHFSEPLLVHSYPCRPPASALTAAKTDEEQLDLDPSVEEDGDIQVYYHPFPSPERLTGPDVEATLRQLSFGYRARYLAQTAQMLCSAHSSENRPRADLKSVKREPKTVKKEEDGDEEQDERPKFASVQAYLSSLRSLSYPEARQELLQFPGVGPKVADCILLMSMDQPSSIPVDRHVFQFAERWYGIRTSNKAGGNGHKAYEMIADRFRNLWGEYAGWAHSVLFTADLRAFKTYGEVETRVKTEVKSEMQGEVKTEVKTEVKEEITSAQINGTPSIKQEMQDPIQTIDSADTTIPDLPTNGRAKRVKRETQTIENDAASANSTLQSHPKRERRQSRRS